MRKEKGVPVRAVCRSLTALQAINRHGSLTMMEIARSISVPYPTVNRLVLTLVYAGLVETVPGSKRYRVTSTVGTLSSGYRSPCRIAAIARPRIVVLTGEILWPVSITTNVGCWMMVRASTDSITALTFDEYEPGHTFPVIESAPGHVFLAHTCEEDRKRLLFEAERLDGRSSSLALFRAGDYLSRIRSDGYSLRSRGPFSAVPGKTSDMSVPIFALGKVAAVLTMTFFAASNSTAAQAGHFVRILKREAEEIGRALANEVPEHVTSRADVLHVQQTASEVGVPQESGMLEGWSQNAAPQRARSSSGQSPLRALTAW